MTKEKEKHKDSKYNNDPNIMGVGIETIGFMSKNGKKLLIMLQIDYRY